jgi:hypothetical protein
MFYASRGQYLVVSFTDVQRGLRAPALKLQDPCHGVQPHLPRTKLLRPCST